MKRKLSHLKPFLKKLGAQYLGDQIPTMASSMVYGTLIAAVPCISFLFIFLSSFGVMNSVKEMLYNYLNNAIGETGGSELISYIEMLTKNASGMGTVGLISFIITFLLLINKIWNNVNIIFRTVPPKGLAKRFAEFLTVLFVGIILIIAFFGLQSIFSDWFAPLLGRPVLSNFSMWAGQLIPKILGWFIIFLLMYYLPGCKVQLSSAMLGSVTAGILLDVLSYIFRHSVKFMVGYSLLYGSFGVLFIFLLYLYCVWTIVFMGVEMCYIHQYRPQHSLSSISGNSPASIIAETMNVLMLISSNYKEGKGGTGTTEIESKLLISPYRLNRYTKVLSENGFIVSSMDESGYQLYIPAKPLDKLFISTITDKIYGLKPFDEDELETVGDAICLQLKEEGSTSFENITVENLLERI